MTIPQQPSAILFVCTFPPKICGIASFTQDLISALSEAAVSPAAMKVCAIDKKGSDLIYSGPVAMKMDAYNLESCIETAQKINTDKTISMLVIEHEFGLYGGEFGEFLLGFLALIDKPFIVRFHTVLPNPVPKMLSVVRHISALAERVIVMTGNSSNILQRDYALDESKIAIIPHGTHANSELTPDELKRKYQLEGRLVLTSFGLLSPNKGIEKGILAMREISKKFPQAIYIVLGRTHPNLIEQEGEKYRDFLNKIIDDNILQENVRLVNEYAPTAKLMEYLTLTDLYLFTSKDPFQAVSGTFLYAMSAGCAIISNSFVLAKEMLDNETGVILQTSEPGELAEEAIRLLGDDKLRKEMSRNAFLRTRNTAWIKVAKKHDLLFREISGTPQHNFPEPMPAIN